MPVPFINLLNNRRRQLPLLARLGIASVDWEPKEVEPEFVFTKSALVEIPDRDTEIARLEIRLRELGITETDNAAA